METPPKFEDGDREPDLSCPENTVKSVKKKQSNGEGRTDPRRDQKPRLKCILKQLVKNSPNRSMKKAKLMRAVRRQLGQNAPPDLALAIDTKLARIRKLSVVNDRVLWVGSQSRSQL